MILRILVSAFLLTPAVASAMCSDRHEQAMSCSDGHTWDPEERVCVPVVSS